MDYCLQKNHIIYQIVLFIKSKKNRCPPTLMKPQIISFQHSCTRLPKQNIKHWLYCQWNTTVKTLHLFPEADLKEDNSALSFSRRYETMTMTRVTRRRNDVCQSRRLETQLRGKPANNRPTGKYRQRSSTQSSVDCSYL